VPIRLAIVGLPRLLADVIAEMFNGDDAVCVDVLANDAAADLTAVGSPPHDVIILGLSDPWGSPQLSRMSRVTRPRLLGVRPDGRESWIYRMQPCPQRLGQASPAQIRTAVLSGMEPSV
jgi:hypothetical protein